MRKRLAAAVALMIPVLGTSAPALAGAADTTPTLVAGAGRAGFGGDGGPATEAALNKPTAAAVAADGTLYLADMVNRRVRAVRPDGVIRTVAGNGRSTVPEGPVPEGTAGTGIALGSPNALALATDGTLFIADSSVSRVYALAIDGIITLRVDPALLGGPIDTIHGLAVTGDGTLYLTDRENSRIVEIPPGAGARPISTPVGLPVGLTADSAGDVWIVSASSMLSRLHDGQLATIVESGDGGWKADSNRPLSSPFDATAVSAGRDGVYIVDNAQRLARRIGADGTVTTAAALPASSFGTRDPVALAAAAAPSGPLYLVDTADSRIFSTPVAAPADSDGGDETFPAWAWAVGGGVLLVLVALLFRMARRRQA